MITLARITNPARLRDWQAVFGTDTIPLLSPISHYARLPGYDQPQLVYEADLAQLTDAQRQLLIIHIATLFGLPLTDVARDLGAVGLPILASDVVITSNDVAALLSAMDDEPTAEDWRALAAADLEYDEL